MTELDLQVRRAQVRLWSDRWLVQTCWTAFVAAVAFALLVLVKRLWGLEWPLLWLGGGLAGGAVVVATGWSFVTRPGRHEAAAALDAAAGLRERVSSGLYYTASTDPFAQAVVSDARETAAHLAVRQHLKLHFPRPATYAAGAMLVSGLLLLLPDGLLQRSEAREQRELTRQVERTRIEVKERLDPLKKIAATNPALRELKEELEQLEQEPAGKLTRPEDVRREALKKIDKLSDALRDQRSSDKFDQVREMKRMLRRVRQPKSGATQELTKALAKGDFKAAQEELQQLQDTLATLKHEEDQQMVKQLQSQLKDLAKQLDKLGDDKQLREKLEQAGVTKEDAERLLKNLSKKDLDQLRKQLEQNGLPQKRVDKLMQQLQARRGACTACKQMSQAMNNAASAAGRGDMDGAAGGMQAAGDQLSEMEQLEQEMNQLDSQLAQVQNARNGMCNKPGGKCDKPGSGMGQLGQGRGGLAPEDGSSGFDYRIHRQKVHTGKGRIIGQYLVDAEQIKGGVSSQLAEAVAAEERDATDAINRDRIPRQYQKSVKEYFSYVQKALGQPEQLNTADGSASSSGGDDAGEAASPTTGSSED
ncbi:MAG: hypothetical protein GY842_19090 [bacterium]|nr:hypothetical protein [bacterium]